MHAELNYQIFQGGHKSGIADFQKIMNITVGLQISGLFVF